MLDEMVALGTGAASHRTTIYALTGVVLLACAFVLRTGTPLALGAALTVALLLPCFYLIFARPLIFPYGLYILLVPFDDLLSVGGANVTLTRMLGIVVGASLLIWCLRKGAAVRPGWAIASLVILYLWMAITTFWATDQWVSVQYLQQYAGLFMLYLALAITPLTFKDFRALLTLGVLAGIGASLFGIYMFYHNPVIAQAAAQHQRMFATAQGHPVPDPNAFADSLLLSATAALMFVLRAPNMAKKFICAAGLGIIVIAILLSGSREAIIALALVSLYFAFRSRYKIELAFVLAGVGMICVFMPSSLWLRFFEASQRSSIWAVAGRAFKDNWLHGYGVGSWLDVYNTYYVRVAQVFPNGWSSAPHNLVAHYAVELGLVGMLIIGFFFYSIFRDLRGIERDCELYDYRVLMEAAVLALIVVAMFIDLFTYKYAWLTLALAAQLRSAALQARDAHAQPVHDGVATIMRLHEPAASLRPQPARVGIEGGDFPYRIR